MALKKVLVVSGNLSMDPFNFYYLAIRIIKKLLPTGSIAM
jgi:hypothetical protein